MQHQKFIELIEKYLDESAGLAEKQQLATMLEDPAYVKLLDELVLHHLASETYKFELGQDVRNSIDQFIYQKTLSGISGQKNIAEVIVQKPIAKLSMHRVHFLKTSWFRYASVAIILFGIGTSLWNSNKNTDQTIVNGNKYLKADIAPGGNKAMLTLSDGTTITLDSAANGAIAQQGNSSIVKSANGEIVYNLKGIAQGAVMMNTMSTPIGGQYQVTLPDGTKVWLNAASSVTYPAAFVGKERKVKVTGEVYFDVAKNKQKPFIVDVDGKAGIEVLGTSFNINSYKDEEDIKTTLLEGSVKVSNSNKQAILKPGEQASIGNTAGIIVKSDADLTQILAWKNGIFDFTGADLKAVMRQLERWYDIKVHYKGSVSNEVFKGKMYRNVNLSDVLETLEQLGVKFRIEGKTLIVL